jgi:DNA-directed RNA polymerase subunit K/omega
MVIRPPSYNPYEFVVVASLRAQQLLAGCVPRVEGDHNATTLAQMEVVEGRVARTAIEDAQGPKQVFWQL